MIYDNSFLEGYNFPDPAVTISHCLEHQRLEAATSDFWKSDEGITRRINDLSEAFSFTVVNNAIKIVAETNNAEWMEWIDVGDSRVCDICKKARSGGKNGFYKIGWFIPKNPAHNKCRCEWKVYFYNPFKVKQTELQNFK